MDLVERIRSGKLGRLVRRAFKRTPEEEILSAAMKYASFSRVPGDYLEFGVYQGNSLIAAVRAATEHRHRDIRFFAFDSFKGLPALSEDAADSGLSPFRQGDFACDRATLERRMRSARMPRERIYCVEGWFDQTLTADTKAALGLTEAAIVWVDCDLYESARIALSFVDDLVVHGTMVLFHDWYCFKADPRMGEQKAFNEWLAGRPDVSCVPYGRFGWNGCAFILNCED